MDRFIARSVARSIAHGIALLALMVSPLQAQRIAAYRGGVSALPRDTAGGTPTFFSVPTEEHFNVAAGYIGAAAGLGAVAGAVTFADHSCEGCGLFGATMGSYLGTALGTKLASDALQCDRINASRRTAIASFVVTSVGLMIGRADWRAGEWTSMLGVPIASAYFVAGCDTK